MYVSYSDSKNEEKKRIMINPGMTITIAMMNPGKITITAMIRMKN